MIHYMKNKVNSYIFCVKNIFFIFSRTFYLKKFIKSIKLDIHEWKIIFLFYCQLKMAVSL
jgi:hypothetical protein